MTAALATLNPAARAALASCEQRIEHGLRGFREIGSALAEIRDNRLYRGEFGTFEDYCQARWNLSRRHCYQLIESAQAVCSIEHTGLPAPANEGQARALAAVPERERAEVWREAVERTEGKPTAKVVAEVARERTAPAAPETPAPVKTPSTAPAGAGSPSPEPAARHLSAVPDPVPSPEQVEARHMEIQRVQILDRARRRAPRLVPEIRDLITEVMAGMNLGERDLITPKTIADLRALVDNLEARMEATR
jgi:hypothetical protein